MARLKVRKSDGLTEEGAPEGGTRSTSSAGIGNGSYAEPRFPARCKRCGGMSRPDGAAISRFYRCECSGCGDCNSCSICSGSADDRTEMRMMGKRREAVGHTCQGRRMRQERPNGWVRRMLGIGSVQRVRRGGAAINSARTSVARHRNAIRCGDYARTHDHHPYELKQLGLQKQKYTKIGEMSPKKEKKVRPPLDKGGSDVVYLPCRSTSRRLFSTAHSSRG